MSLLQIWLIGLVWSTGWCTATGYREHLVLQPLPQSALLAGFNFQSNTSVTEYEQQNYNLFPRSLGQILLHTHAKELHLRFALGRWDAQSWGARPRGGQREGGTGVELWAWIQADTEKEANSRWFTLTNALSGLFCASLNFVDQTKTIRPVSSFDREGISSTEKLHLLHGALPHEVVCTENLTPFLKLLPCKGKAGISSLLDGHKLFDASWQTMAIDVRTTCPADGGECQIEMEQTVDMVLDIERSMRPAKDPIPRPPPIEQIACDTSKYYNGFDTCYPADRTAERAWSLKDIFGRPIQGSCPLNQQAEQQVGEIELRIPQSRSANADVSPKSSSAHSRFYQLPRNNEFDIKVDEYPVGKDFDLQSPALHAERTFTGYGQERGGVHAVLTNTSPAPLEMVYLESLPWFMKPYLHTLKAVVTPSGTATNSTSSIKDILYRPALDRQRGTHLELRLSVPAASTLTLSYYFEKAILRYTEYPPDANRGFDVAPAVIRILGGDEPVYVRTTSLLLPLPTPDFSMPYNVIILTSTVIAMGFGSIFNLLTRRFVAADEVEPSKLGGLKGKLRDGIRGLKGKVRARLAGKKAAGKVTAESRTAGEGTGDDGRVARTPPATRDSEKIEASGNGVAKSAIEA
ncbi:Gpi16 subunit, GPI transamidase component [Myriangium duriaei CBS 260.36]|uniref:Gpi16 subunit, GPI transamidase component n=1 Tax=Myriangium duriaei CBS 260.36 TaxID=1168546 RepID=A0A9P4MDQ3_9PEZI|nr:Gpi16 subunit, GPI transamidase component [Myriangium duriaei CBS 260.36]